MGVVLVALVLAIPQAMAKSNNHQGKDTTTPTQQSQNESTDATASAQHSKQKTKGITAAILPSNNYGPVPVGTTAKQNVLRVGNNGDTDQQLTAIRFKGSKAFAQAGNVVLPLTLPAHTAIGLQVGVFFTPTKTGKYKGSLTLTVGNTKKTISLRGTGVTA
jgi:hypothetical protein